MHGQVSSLLEIERAVRSDMAAVLHLQRLAFRSEAERYDDPALPPLTETLPELYAVWARMPVLKATVDGRLVGSVRGYAEAGTCHIGRLAVHPAFQDRGIGTRLMQAIEAQFSSAQRFEVFTGHRSTKSLHLYRKLGYTPCKTLRVNDRLTLVYLAKRNR
jgi:ribosomal protein S18 acetylase RimI-like enzyme